MRLQSVIALPSDQLGSVSEFPLKDSAVRSYLRGMSLIVLIIWSLPVYHNVVCPRMMLDYDRALSLNFQSRNLHAKTPLFSTLRVLVPWPHRLFPLLNKKSGLSWPAFSLRRRNPTKRFPGTVSNTATLSFPTLVALCGGALVTTSRQYPFLSPCRPRRASPLPNPRSYTQKLWMSLRLFRLIPFDTRIILSRIFDFCTST